jgi:serine/threonine protein kinase
MAEVYLARDLDLLRDVAVKVLPSALAADAGYVARFRDEGRRVAALNHPNIVPVYSYGEEPGLLYLVMPVMRESLRDRMDHTGIMPASEAIGYAQEIAAALEAAHDQDIVHRDVKPENVLIDADGKSLLTDFGIAREVAFLRQTGTARTLAATGLPVGTPEYMAPEQLRASDVDQRADIYALGVVLYEMLTGVVPFEAGTPYEVASLVLTAQVAPPSQRNLMIWPELEQVVLRALAKDPADRYASAVEMRQALDDAFHWRSTPTAGPVTTTQGSAALPVRTHAPLLAPVATQAPMREARTAETSTTMADAEDGPLRSWNEQQPPDNRPRRRKPLVLAAIGIVLAIAIVGTSGVLFASGMFRGPNATSGTAGAGTAAVNTVTVASTPTHPRATAVPTATVVPTTTSVATTVPSHVLTFSAVTLTRTKGTCFGTQIIKNTEASPTGWQWVSISPMPDQVTWWLNSSTTKHGWPPQPGNSSLAAGAQDTLSVTFSCKAIQYKVVAKDSNGNSYSFTVQAP